MTRCRVTFAIFLLLLVLYFALSYPVKEVRSRDVLNLIYVCGSFAVAALWVMSVVYASNNSVVGSFWFVSLFFLALFKTILNR